MTIYDTHPQNAGDLRALHGREKLVAAGQSVRRWAFRAIEEWGGGKLLDAMGPGRSLADASEIWLPDVVLCDVSALPAGHLLADDSKAASAVAPSPVYRLGCFLGFAVPGSALAEFHGHPAR